MGLSMRQMTAKIIHCSLHEGSVSGLHPNIGARLSFAFLISYDYITNHGKVPMHFGLYYEITKLVNLTTSENGGVKTILTSNFIPGETAAVVLKMLLRFRVLH